MLVMLSLSEVIFTTFYIYLSQRLDVIPMTGAAIYTGAVTCLYDCYVREKYEDRKKELLDSLIS
jgi:hypothetical protein